MKKSFFIVAIGVLSVFAVFTASAQKVKSFAGTIKVSVNYTGANRNPQKHVPHEALYTIFGNKMKIQDGTWVLYIYDGDAGTKTMLVDIPGNRGGFVFPKEAVEEELGLSNKKFTYTKREETKTICGYVCTRYDVTIYDTEEEEETKAIVYTTTEIGENSNINTFSYPGLTGFPLYSESEENGVKTIQEAIEVKPTKVKAVDFLIPTDYKMMTGTEFNAYIKALQETKE